MPYEIRVKEEDGGVITTYWGTVTDEDIIRSVKEKRNLAKNTKNLYYAITDLSRVEDFKVSAAGIEHNAEISSQIIREIGYGIVAFVLPTILEYGMGRMWQAYGEQQGIKSVICKTLDEAEAWIKSNLKS